MHLSKELLLNRLEMLGLICIKNAVLQMPLNMLRDQLKHVSFPYITVTFLHKKLIFIQKFKILNFVGNSRSRQLQGIGLEIMNLLV